METLNLLSIAELRQWGNEEWLKGNHDKARRIWRVYERVRERWLRSRKMSPFW